MQSTKLKAPFGWVGGKSKLAKDIIALIPEHKLYIEVFLTESASTREEQDLFYIKKNQAS